MKALVILFLIVAVFGGGAWATYELFFRPAQQLAEEKLRPAPPPPPDPTLPDYEKCLTVQKTGDILAARAAFEQFIEHFPHSSKIDEAKDRLGEINTDIFLSTKPAPEKQEYIVRSGDVLNRVATKLKTTPELIMRANNLSGTMLRIGQKITIAPAEFSLFIDKGAKKVTLLNKGKFFKQYPIRSVPERLVPPKKGAAAPPPATGKITDKIAWSEAGERVIFSDKDYAGAAHWIVSSIGGHTLYSMAEEGAGKNYKTPPSGLGIAPEHAEELSAMLSKGTAVTIR